MERRQCTGRTIKLNHSNALPRYIISLAVESTANNSSAAPRAISYSFNHAALVSGRLVGTKIESRTVVVESDRHKLWQQIYALTRSNYTTWLVGYSVLRDLILCGLPHEFACGNLSIDKPRAKRQREDNDIDNVHAASLAVIENPPTVLGCLVGSTRGRMVIVDLANWFPEGVIDDQQKTGTVLALATRSKNIAVTSLPPVAFRACATHICFEKLIAFVREKELGLFRYTAASQAYGAFRHRFMREQIYCHDNQAAQSIERQAYFGGRGEAFRICTLREPVWKLDCNSLFPSVMRTGNFPTMLDRYEIRKEYLPLLPSIAWSKSVAECDLRATSPVYPVRTDKGIIYPVGRFRTTLCGDELALAHRNRDILAIQSWCEYKTGNIFRDFVEELWALRQAYRNSGDLMYEKLSKRIMNSLYGKFGQLTPAWQPCANDWSMLPWTTESRRESDTGAWTTLRAIGYFVQKLCERKPRDSSFYAIPAFVTAAARCRMNDLRLIAGAREVYYQGVDSLIVSWRGYKLLMDAGEVYDREIGKLRVELAAESGQIRGINDYELGETVVVAGRARQTETTEYGQIMQHRTFIEQHLFKRGPVDTIEERVDSWYRTSKYVKGHVSDDGWVEPFTIGVLPTSSIAASLPDVAAT